MFSRLEALPESESRHELGAEEGFVKGEIGGKTNGQVGEKNLPCSNEAFEGRGFEELGFRGGGGEDVNWPVWSEDCGEVKEERKEVREWSGFEDNGYFVATMCCYFAG
jgi:hypothetical protein